MFSLEKSQIVSIVPVGSTLSFYDEQAKNIQSLEVDHAESFDFTKKKEKSSLAYCWNGRKEDEDKGSEAVLEWSDRIRLPVLGGGVTL